MNLFKHKSSDEFKQDTSKLIERVALCRLFLGNFEKKIKAKKLKPKKPMQIFEKLKQIIQKLSQLKTDFLLKKVLKLIYFVQKFAKLKFFY